MSDEAMSRRVDALATLMEHQEMMSICSLRVYMMLGKTCRSLNTRSAACVFDPDLDGMDGVREARTIILQNVVKALDETGPDRQYLLESSLYTGAIMKWATREDGRQMMRVGDVVCSHMLSEPHLIALLPAIRLVMMSKTDGLLRSAVAQLLFDEVYPVTKEESIIAMARRLGAEREEPVSVRVKALEFLSRIYAHAKDKESIIAIARDVALRKDDPVRKAAARLLALLPLDAMAPILALMERFVTHASVKDCERSTALEFYRHVPEACWDDRLARAILLHLRSGGSQEKALAAAEALANMPARLMTTDVTRAFHKRAWEYRGFQGAFLRLIDRMDEPLAKEEETIAALWMMATDTEEASHEATRKLLSLPQDLVLTPTRWSELVSGLRGGWGGLPDHVLVSLLHLVADAGEERHTHESIEAVLRYLCQPGEVGAEAFRVVLKLPPRALRGETVTKLYAEALRPPGVEMVDVMTAVRHLNSAFVLGKRSEGGTKRKRVATSARYEKKSWTKLGKATGSE